MKVLLTVAFDGDRDAFAADAVGRLAEVVGSGAAGQATLDVRLPDNELEALGSELMTQQEERAVIALWDTDADTALSMPLPPGGRMVGAYHVEEVVLKDYDRTWPSGTQSPGFKMIPFLHRRADLTQEAFSRHWRERHGPLAVARQPGFWHYVQNHLVERLSDASPDWDGFGEIHYRTLEDALTRSYDSAEAQQLIWEDVARFLAYDRSPTLTTHEWVITSG
ncbi:MAG TPA: EthD domain-containing protein [Acidimicrobiales bacterium]|nr:EthD domain-containing protein [Acidimicrobiales bacterium]